MEKMRFPLLTGAIADGPTKWGEGFLTGLKALTMTAWAGASFASASPGSPFPKS